jgi:hypothetical protein
MQLTLQIIWVAGTPCLATNYLWMKLTTGRGLFFNINFRKRSIQWENGIALSSDNGGSREMLKVAR